jgi:hypothetical protein
VDALLAGLRAWRGVSAAFPPIRPFSFFVRTTASPRILASPICCAPCAEGLANELGDGRPYATVEGERIGTLNAGLPSPAMADRRGPGSLGITVREPSTNSTATAALPVLGGLPSRHSSHPRRPRCHSVRSSRWVVPDCAVAEPRRKPRVGAAQSPRHPIRRVADLPSCRRRWHPGRRPPSSRRLLLPARSTPR